MIRLHDTPGRVLLGCLSLAAAAGGGCSGEADTASPTERPATATPAAPAPPGRPAGANQPGGADYSGKGIHTNGPEGR